MPFDTCRKLILRTNQMYQVMARSALRRYGPRVLKAGAKRVARYAISRYSKRRSSNKRGGSKETAFLTYDNDFKTDYRYKRMPRRKRRAWKKFTKKVDAVINKSQGLKKHLYTRVFNTSSPTSQTFYDSAMLYTPDARVDTLDADIGTMFREMLPAGSFDDAYNLATVGDISSFLRFESAVMEVTWTNNGVAPLIIDLYYVRCRKDFPLTSTNVQNNAQGIYNLGFLKQERVEDINDGNVPFVTGQTAIQYGTTPFQSPLFCQHYKVLTKQKLVIAPGNTISRTLKDSKNRRINATDIRASICKRNLTHGYFWQHYGVPGVVEVPVVAVSSNLTTVVTKKYSYYIPVSNKDQASSGLV